jgi:CRISPR system Cascade subunit CasD
VLDVSGQPISFLVLRLEAPLQSWGTRAQWSVRDTAGEPTKSGVVGLLAACLGWGPDQDARIAELTRHLALGVRIDRPGRVLVDFHTVSGGVMSAEGKVKKTASTKEPETVVSRRHYLADAAFTVVLGAPPEWLDRLAGALADPVWPPYLGRKCCPPTAPLLAGRVLASDLRAALESEPYRPRPREPVPRRLRCIMDAPAASDDDRPGLDLSRQDVPLSLAARRFGSRTVREFEVPTPLPDAADPIAAGGRREGP